MLYHEARVSYFAGSRYGARELEIEAFLTQKQMRSSYPLRIVFNAKYHT